MFLMANFQTQIQKGAKILKGQFFKFIEKTFKKEKKKENCAKINNVNCLFALL